MWRNLTFFVAFPVIILGNVNAFFLGDDHHKRPEFIPYEHLRIRSKVRVVASLGLFVLC